MSYAAPGLVAYIKAGGRFQDLNRSDLTDFNRLMGASSRNYQFPLYSDMSISPGALMVLRDQFAEGVREPQFVKCAIH